LSLFFDILGFGDLVPMQKDDYGSIGSLYILFCIMFILIGLTIVAASGNLLILRFVEMNSKRCQHERFEMEERRRQTVRIIGDVISSNGRLLRPEEDNNNNDDDDDNHDRQRITTSFGAVHHIRKDRSRSDLSLCSCRGQTLCLPISCKKKFQRRRNHLFKTNYSKSPILLPRTLKDDILESLKRKSELDEHVVLERSYLQLNQMLKRSSI